MSSSATEPVVAAGAVCWRLVDGKPKVLIVYRPHHHDYSLPKGKVDPGETLPETAVREVAEETGLPVVLGPPLAEISYTMPNGRQKIVHYWSAEVSAHALQLAKFVPNDEIASLEWMPLAKARKRLTYPHDNDVLDRFEELLTTGRARTFAIIAARHGKAVSPSAWDGPDPTRPLLQRGTEQANGIAKGIAAFAPERIISSTAARCLATMAPLAALIGVETKPSERISQDALERGRSDVAGAVARRLRKRNTAVLCSHGPVIPRILAAVAEQTGTPLDDRLKRAAMLDTGDFSVVHLSLGDKRPRIVAVEHHSPA